MIVGFAGLGRMGWPMAANLASQGFELVVWNRSPERARSFAQQYGVEQADNPCELTARCDLVITMLADNVASQAVHCGKNGLFESLQPAKDSGYGCTFVEMGTLSPDHLEELRQQAKGHPVIDAPVSGATQAATDAQLLIMVGATAAEIEPWLPVLKAMGREVIPLSAPGSGAVMKLAVNMLIHGFNQCLAESLALATSAGIQAEEAFRVIENSAAAAPSLKYRKGLYLNESGQDVTFTVSLARKDMDLALALAKDRGVKAPQSTVTFDELDKAARSGYGDRDMAAMVHFIKQG